MVPADIVAEAFFVKRGPLGRRQVPLYFCVPLAPGTYSAHSFCASATGKQEIPECGREKKSFGYVECGSSA
jgi:hypothetical protein